jgi:hypothetical protein
MLQAPAVTRITGRHCALVLGLAVVAIFLSMVRITPKLVPWRDHPLVYETTKVEPMLDQLKDPVGWERKYRGNWDFNGVQTIRWRLLPPALGQVLQLSPHAYLTLPWVALAGLVALAIHYALRFGATPLGAGAVGVLAGTSSAFFSSSCAVGYFDPLYLIALVIVCCSPSQLAVLAACLLGPWVDEKFLFMLPACCAARWAWQADRRWIWRVLAGIAPYCLVRLAALAQGDDSLRQQIAMQAAAFAGYAPALPAGWWYGFRAGWVPVIGGIWLVCRAPDRRVAAFFIAGLLAAIGAVSFLAWDTTRSIAMLLPFLVLGTQATWVTRLLPALAVLNLLLPAAYVWCGAPVTVPLSSILAR